MKVFNLLFLFAVTIGAAQAADMELKIRHVSKAVSLNPFDAAWNASTALEVVLMPQTFIPPGGGGTITRVRVQALQTRNNIFFRLEWPDAQSDSETSQAEGFTDAVALQFPEQPETIPSPFMGDKQHAVSIWRWSAGAQADIEHGFRSNDHARPRLAADLYPYPNDPTFRSGEKTGNIVSQKHRSGPVESLTARGYGTLTPTKNQPVKGKGVWKDGRWHVVFRRSLKGTPSFSQKDRFVFALAAWDGGTRERNGRKSVSVWQTLSLPSAEKIPAQEPLARGRRVFQRYGCAVCHGEGDAGGIANPNAQVNPIPSLKRVREGYSKQELLQVIFRGKEPVRQDPYGPPARFKMNAWQSVMSTQEADALVEYLFSLLPEGEEDEW